MEQAREAFFRLLTPLHCRLSRFYVLAELIIKDTKHAKHFLTRRQRRVRGASSIFTFRTPGAENIFPPEDCTTQIAPLLASKNKKLTDVCMTRTHFRSFFLSSF